MLIVHNSAAGLWGLKPHPLPTQNWSSCSILSTHPHCMLAGSWAKQPVLVTHPLTLPQVMISAPIQMLTAWRITIISESKLVGAIICIFAILSVGELFRQIEPYLGDFQSSLSGGGCWTGATVAIINDLVKKPETDRSATVWLVASTVADILITVSLVYSLVCVHLILPVCTTLIPRWRIVAQENRIGHWFHYQSCHCIDFANWCYHVILCYSGFRILPSCSGKHLDVLLLWLLSYQSTQHTSLSVIPFCPPDSC